MPRRPRLAAGDLAYHVLNRRVGPTVDAPLATKVGFYGWQSVLGWNRLCGLGDGLKTDREKRLSTPLLSSRIQVLH